MAVPVHATINFSTIENKTNELIITNGSARYNLNIESVNNCTIKKDNVIVSAPVSIPTSGSCTIYPNNDNWNVICYNVNDHVQ